MAISTLWIPTRRLMLHWRAARAEISSDHQDGLPQATCGAGTGRNTTGALFPQRTIFDSMAAAHGKTAREGGLSVLKHCLSSLKHRLSLRFCLKGRSHSASTSTTLTRKGPRPRTTLLQVVLGRTASHRSCPFLFLPSSPANLSRLLSLPSFPPSPRSLPPVVPSLPSFPPSQEPPPAAFSKCVRALPQLMVARPQSFHPTQ